MCADAGHGVQWRVSGCLMFLAAAALQHLFLQAAATVPAATLHMCQLAAGDCGCMFAAAACQATVRQQMPLQNAVGHTHAVHLRLLGLLRNLRQLQGMCRQANDPCMIWRISGCIELLLAAAALHCGSCKGPPRCRQPPAAVQACGGQGPLRACSIANVLERRSLSNTWKAACRD